MDKLTILADSAKYDASCSSSGSTRQNKRGGVGNAENSGICHTWAADGRCISLLKILLTNVCVYDCSYCINRVSNDVQRVMFTPEEVAELTINFYRKNYIEGLFLSSGVVKSPDYTMELIAKALSILRNQYRFNGYIHTKIIPGANAQLIDKIGKLADRVSVNIEMPSSQSLKLLAPQKESQSILKPMKRIGTLIDAHLQERKKNKRAPQFVPAGQSTQMIVGATPDSDYKIISLSEQLYQKMNLKRVYYSAYIHVNKDSRLPVSYRPQLLREHRLYQADWLMRVYGFESHEIIDSASPNLSTEYDPKVAWALAHLAHFPVEINTAAYETLLRIPGIGIRSARKIVCQRRVKALTYEDLQKLRVVIKRAKYFITVKGKYYGEYAADDQAALKLCLSQKVSKQLDLFETNYLPSVIYGEL